MGLICVFRKRFDVFIKAGSDADCAFLAYWAFLCMDLLSVQERVLLFCVINECHQPVFFAREMIIPGDERVRS